MKDKLHVSLMALISVSVIITLGIYMIAADFDLGSMGISSVMIIVAILAIYVAFKGVPFIAENLGIEIIGRHVSYLIIMSGAILFFLFYFLLNRKEDI
jgi:hypothetical protein